MTVDGSICLSRINLNSRASSFDNRKAIRLPIGSPPASAVATKPQTQPFRLPVVRSTMSFLSGTLARHVTINCGVPLLSCNAGRDFRPLPIDAAKADIAIGPRCPRGYRLAMDLRRCEPGRTRHDCQQGYTAEKHIQSFPPHRILRPAISPTNATRASMPSSAGREP